MKTLKTTCRWCAGDGLVVVFDSPSGSPNDPNGGDVECECPECDGEGTVCASVAVEQREQSEQYMSSVYESALENHIERHDNDDY